MRDSQVNVSWYADRAETATARLGTLAFQYQNASLSFIKPDDRTATEIMQDR
jgi:hypothetical protein